tara:strand:- start:4595 stop:5647 length:1053 start_codon:yes stop_codon:yes gene_type:complete
MNKELGVEVSEERLRKLMEEILLAVGCDSSSAKTTADVLIEADLRGYGTHGLIRLPAIVNRIQSGMIDPKAIPYIKKENGSCSLVEGERSIGAVGAKYGATLAAKNALSQGCSTVGVVNSDHICLTGYYAELIARMGCVGIVLGITTPLVHPIGGIERLLGTNPLAIAIPSSTEDPYLLDFATSSISNGLVMKAAVEGESIPEGVALGPDGIPTMDPNQASKGALTPFGGHKGYGLCLTIGLLAGPLLGAKVGKPLAQSVADGHYDKGDLFIAIDPSSFGDTDVFRDSVFEHLYEVKSIAKSEGTDEIRIPGERAYKERKRRLQEGLTIEVGIWNKINVLCKELNVNCDV